MVSWKKRFVLLSILGVTSFAMEVSLASVLPSMRARAIGNGKVDVDIVYYAEDTCISIANVREGHPPTIEAPQKALVVTATIERAQGKSCKPELKTLTHNIVINDRPGIRSVEIFFVSKEGKFIRSSRPRIYRDEVDIE